MAERTHRSSTNAPTQDSEATPELAPGKRTLVEGEYARMANRPGGEQFPGQGAIAGMSGLPGPVLQKMSHSFGTDFSHVQVHPESREAESHGARAFTQGSNIHFAPGQYDPASQSGQELIGHELAHVVQQGSGRVPTTMQAKGGVGLNQDAALEAEADHLGARAARGEVVASAGRLTESHTGPIQRKTTIVDDTADAQNKTAKGTGRGRLQNSQGNIQSGVVFGPLRDECATWMEAWLNTNAYDPQGTEPKRGTWPSWWTAAAPKPNNYWVRGHLLNHNLGGPGEPRNLAPITKTANSEHHNNVEKVLKLAGELGGSLVGYKVTATYGGAGPTGLQGDANDPDKSVWHKLPLGFDCEYIIIVDHDDQKTFKTFVENKR